MQRALTAAALFVLFCMACATVEKVSTDARLVEAQAAFDEGRRLNTEGKYAEAVPLFERALELREAALGGSHLEVARCLNLLGNIHQELGHYARAELLLKRALTIREAELGKSHQDVAQVLHNLSVLHGVQNQLTEAMALSERALAIREQALGKNHLDVATSLNMLATLHLAQGQYAKARPLYERAHAIRKEALGEDHLDVSYTLQNLGDLEQDEGHYEKAQALYEKVLAIRQKALGKSHPQVAYALSSLASHYHLVGLYEEAKVMHERALETFKTAFGDKHYSVAMALHNFGLFYALQGKYAEAEPLYQDALAIQEEVLGRQHPHVPIILVNLANLYVAQGQFTRAKPLYERALVSRQEVLGEKHPDVAKSLNSLAAFHLRQGQYAEAERLYGRALAILEESSGKDHAHVASLLNNLAILHALQGHHAKAQALYERSLAILEKSYGAEHPDVARSLNDLANLHAVQGDLARAGSMHERALAILEKRFGKRHPDVANTLHFLAELRLTQRRLDKALPLFERAFSVSEDYLRQEILSYSESRLTSVLQLFRTEEESLYALVRRHPENARVRQLALTAALLRKGRSVEELADTSRLIYQGLGPDERERFKRLRALRTQLSTLAFEGPERLSPANHQQRLKELSEQADALEAQLARRSAPLRALHALPPPSEFLTRVAAALPKEGVLIEFIAYSDSPLVPSISLSSLEQPGELRYLALLLFSQGRTLAVDLGPAAPIDRAAQRLHDAFVRRDVAYSSTSREFYDLIFRPLAPHLNPTQRLFLAPDGQLSLVPFAALHDGKRFLLDAWDFTYLTSGKDLLREPVDARPTQSVVVLADPDFNSASAAGASQAARTRTEGSPSLQRFYSTLRSELSNRSWVSLKGTRQEAEAIQRLLPQARLLMGPKATKMALLNLEPPIVLHVATHGFFLEDVSSPAGVRAVKNGGLVGSDTPQAMPNPLLRSGLVLAGARAEAQPSASARQDSLVTALELAGMNLWGTQLVVLSACDTGRGDVKLGQGVYGLRRALMVAGAETVVTSLWTVNDETTAELMEGYYRRLLAGQGRAAALREAMRELRRKNLHPYYWAPFIAIGQDGALRGLTPDADSRPER
jgi:CHAT domain-containing protein/multidrug resistance efflux pump